MKELRTQIWSPSFFISEREKKNDFLLALNPPWIHLQCVHMCIYECVYERANLPHRRWYWRQKTLFLAFFPLDLFSNVDVYHLSRPAIYHPPFLSIIRKGVNLLKCESLSFIWFYSPLPLSPSLSSYLSVCPVAAQVRDGRGAQSGCNRVMSSLAAGFGSVFGAEMAPSLVCEIHLNRFQIPLIFH